MGPARRLLRLPRALPPLQRGPGTAGPGARPRPPRPRVCGTWKGQGLDSGPVEGTRRPENGSLSPGVMWEPPTGEASISLSPVFCLTPAVCPPPRRWPHCLGWHKSPLPSGKQFLEKATQASGDSPGILKGPLPSEGWAWARLSYFSWHTEI